MIQDGKRGEDWRKGTRKTNVCINVIQQQQIVARSKEGGKDINERGKKESLK